jgi:hypothetical protein
MKNIYKTQTSDCEVDPVKSSKAQSPRNMAHIYCDNDFSETLKYRYTLICFYFQRDRYFLLSSKGRSWQNLILKLTLRYYIKWYHIHNAFSRRKWFWNCYHSSHWWQLCMFSFTGSVSDIAIIPLTDDSWVYMFSFPGSGSHIVIIPYI